MNNNKEYLKAADVCELLGMNKQGVQRLVALGLLKAYRPTPRKTYFTREMVEEYLKGGKENAS